MSPPWSQSPACRSVEGLVLAGWLRPSAEDGTSVTSHLRLSQKGWGMTVHLHGCVPDGETEARQWAWKGQPNRMPRNQGGPRTGPSSLFHFLPRQLVS